MADYNYIDKQGLTKFWQKSKEYITEEDSKLLDKIDEETQARENAILVEQTARNQAIATAVNAESEARQNDFNILDASIISVNESVSAEIENRETADEGLSSRIDTVASSLNNLSDDVSNLSDSVADIQDSYIEDVRVEGKSVVENKVADISLGSLVIVLEDLIDEKVAEAVDEEVEHLQDRFVISDEKGAADGVATLDSEGLVPVEQIPDLSDSYLNVSSVGQAGGVATLGPDGKVPIDQLPEIETSSVIKVNTFEDLTYPGESGKIYIVLDTNSFYKWDLNLEDYSSIGSGGGSSEDIEMIKQALLNHQTRIEGLETSVSEISADVVQNSSDISDIESNIQGVQESIAEVSRDLDEVEESFENLEISVTEALESKLSFEDVIDSLESSDTDRPLSANQGSVIKSNIDSLSSRIDSLQMTFKFKGTVSSYEELPEFGNMEGDVYQIVSEGEDDGETYAWNGSVWVQISAAAIDISSMLSTIEDINVIINRYK